MPPPEGWSSPRSTEDKSPNFPAPAAPPPTAGTIGATAAHRPHLPGQAHVQPGPLAGDGDPSDQEARPAARLAGPAGGHCGPLGPRPNGIVGPPSRPGTPRSSEKGESFTK